jgi:hypothetical protein
MTNRRWFRVSLATMFSVVAVFGCWLGWSIYQVHGREQVRQLVVSLKGGFTSGQPTRPWKSPPLMWRFLGVESIQRIDLQGSNLSEEDRSHISAAFPEAEIAF